MTSEVIRLGDVATYINGYAFKPGDWSDVGLPIIRIQDLTGTSYQLNYYDGEYPKNIEINDGDVLISWSASLGVYIWSKGKVLLNQHIFKVIFDKASIDKKYFVFAVKYKLKEMQNKTHGATMKHIVKKDFDNTLIPYPNEDKQKKIAYILEKVSEIIENEKYQLELLDNLIKSRFVEMFGGIHDSTLYPYATIESFTSVMSGGTPDRGIPEYWQEGNIRWVKTTELQNCVITDTEEKITQLGMDNSSTKLIPADSVLIAMYGQGKTRGMTGYIAVECATNQACACILPSKTINQKYLWQYMILSYDKLRDMAKGGNQPNLNTGIIKKYPVLMPPIALQEWFATFVQSVDKLKSEIPKSLDETQTLMDSLMQKYFG